MVSCHCFPNEIAKIIRNYTNQFKIVINYYADHRNGIIEYCVVINCGLIYHKLEMKSSIKKINQQMIDRLSKFLSALNNNEINNVCYHIFPLHITKGSSMYIPSIDINTNHTWWYYILGDDTFSCYIPVKYKNEIIKMYLDIFNIFFKEYDKYNNTHLSKIFEQS